MIFLVTGARGTYGSVITDELRLNGHVVYEAQKKPRKYENPDIAIEFWLSTDFDDAADMVLLGQQFYTRDIKLDGVVHCVKRDDRVNDDDASIFQVEHHIAVNVLNPIFLTRYLRDFGVLTTKARVLFPLDKTEKQKSTPYSISKSIVVTAVQAILKDTLDVFYPVFPDADGTDSVTVASNVCELLTDSIAPKSQLIPM